MNEEWGEINLKAKRLQDIEMSRGKKEESKLKQEKKTGTERMMKWTTHEEASTKTGKEWGNKKNDTWRILKEQRMF